MSQPCLKCEGKGGIGTFGPCAPGTMHFKYPCPCCDGRCTTGPLNKCTVCNGLGGQGTFGPCEKNSIHYASPCGVCRGRCYLPAAPMMPSAPMLNVQPTTFAPPTSITMNFSASGMQQSYPQQNPTQIYSSSASAASYPGSTASSSMHMHALQNPFPPGVSMHASAPSMSITGPVGVSVGSTGFSMHAPGIRVGFQPPSVWIRPQLQWTPYYDPRQPFIPPPGLTPQQASAVTNASWAFRQFDRNFSGTLGMKEFKRAMMALGCPLHKGQARMIYFLIDRDRSGSISEREFCEYWMIHGTQGAPHHHHPHHMVAPMPMPFPGPGF